MDNKIKIFIDSCVILTAVADEKSKSAELLRKCEQGDFLCFISKQVIEECRNKLDKYPGYLKRFDKLLGFLKQVKVSDDDIKKYDTIKDINDRHVLAGAVNCNADYIVTLDWKHFLSRSAKERLKNYPIPRTFPNVLVNPFRESRLPNISFNLFSGTFSILVEPQWTSDTIKHANRPFYILDFPNVFSMYYEPDKQRIKFITEVYINSIFYTFSLKIDNGDAFINIVTWDANRGFTIMVNGRFKRISRRWDTIPLNSNLYIGSDRNGINQINSLLEFDGWPKDLSEKELWRILEGDYITLPEKPVTL